MIKKEKIKVSEDSLLLSRAISRDFKKIADKCIKEEGQFFIALSGGSTPQLYLEKLSIVFTSWQKVHIFWNDERCVPPNSAESNYNMIKENFLQLIDIPSINIHRMRGEDEPDIEADRYSKEIMDWVPQVNGHPCFDIIFLGVGTDGHTASIFPDQMELFESDKICATAIQPVSGQMRITLTGKVINNAKNIFVVVTGEEKAEIMRDLLGKENDSSKYPAGMIRPVNGKLEWFLDKEAAGLLNLG